MAGKFCRHRSSRNPVVVHRPTESLEHDRLSLHSSNDCIRGRLLIAISAVGYLTWLLLIRFPARFTCLIKQAIELIAAKCRRSLFRIGVCSSLLWLSETTVTGRFTVSVVVEQEVYMARQEALAETRLETCKSSKKVYICLIRPRCKLKPTFR